MATETLMTVGSAPSRVLIVDDHPYFSAGLATGLDHLYPHIRTCSAANLAAAREVLLRDADIDLILLELSLAGDEGLSLLPWMDEHERDIPVIVDSSRDDPLAITAAQRQGAMAYLSKSADAQTLRRTIDAVMQGQRCFSVASTPVVALTPRQLEVLALLAAGMPNKRICDRLNLTEHTIKSHLKTIFQLLDVHNRTECVQVAQRLGLVDPRQLS